MRRSDPEIQNIPIRTSTGKSIRDAFIGQTPLFPSADYSQVELRILAQLEKEKEKKKEIVLYLDPDADDGKEVIELFQDAGIKFSIIPTTICPEVTKGSMRLQSMDEIKNFILSQQGVSHD